MMTELNPLINLIESVAFAIRYSPASGFKTVRNALEIDAEVQALITILRQDATTPPIILGRIRQLIEHDMQADPKSVDEALTAYLYALYEAACPGVDNAIELIKNTPHLFWARRMAQHILAEMQQTPH